MAERGFRRRVIIIKADDFGRGEMQDSWRHFIDVCLTNYVRPSVGIIARDLQTSKASQALARYHHETGNVELWNHSNAHSNMTTLSAGERRDDVVKSQATIRDLIGYEPEIFGPPFNAIDHAAIREIMAAHPFKAAFCCEGADDLGFINIDRKWLISPEISTQMLNRVSFPFFLKTFERRGAPEVLIIQVHPGYWRPADAAEFEKVLHFAFHREYQPLTGLEYASYLAAVAARSSPLGGNRAINAGSVARVQEMLYRDYQAGKIPEIFSDADREYYFRRLRLGTARLSEFLRQYGLSALAERGEATIIDVGGGLGNWAMAAKTVVPSAVVRSVDTNARIADVFAPYVAEERSAADAKLVQFETGDATALNLNDGACDFVICNNALNYMPVDKSLLEFARVTRSGGAVFVGVQNALYPVVDALRYLERGDLGGALGRLERLVNNISRRSAGSHTNSFISYWSDEELTTVAMFCGLQPMYRGITLPEEYGSLFGSPVLWGYVFFKTNPSARRGEELRQGVAVTARDHVLLKHAGAVGILADLHEAGRRASPREERGDAERQFGLDAREEAALTDWQAGKSCAVEAQGSFVVHLIGWMTAIRAGNANAVVAETARMLAFLAVDANRLTLLSGEDVEGRIATSVGQAPIAAAEIERIVSGVRAKLLA